MLSRRPRPPLRPFVDLVWASAPEAGSSQSFCQKELVLPTGAAHLVFRLEDAPLRLYAGLDDNLGEAVGTALIGGARASFYIKDVSYPVPTVGAMVRPGAIELLSKIPAINFADKHTRIEDIWPRSVLSDMMDQLRESPDPMGRLDLFEDFLSSLLPRVHAIHPLVAHALGRFEANARVGDVAAETGFSQRHLTRIFTGCVGLNPKTYCRVRRFGRLLERMNASAVSDLADLAAAEGYADQAHMTREFHALAGVTPARYVIATPANRHHFPI